MRTTTASTTALLALLAAQPSAASPLCFYPDGTIDYNQFPCDATANPSLGQQSACCHANDACFSDGTCLTNDSDIPYRGTCTDSSWKTDQCPGDICTSQPGENFSSSSASSPSSSVYLARITG